MFEIGTFHNAVACDGTGLNQIIEDCAKLAEYEGLEEFEEVLNRVLYGEREELEMLFGSDRAFLITRPVI